MFCLSFSLFLAVLGNTVYQRYVVKTITNAFIKWVLPFNMLWIADAPKRLKLDWNCTETKIMNINIQNGFKTGQRDLDFGPIWTNLDHSAYLDPSSLTHLFGPVYLDLSIWTCIFGPVYVELFLWTHLFGPIYLDPFIWTRLFESIYWDPYVWTYPFGLLCLD